MVTKVFLTGVTGYIGGDFAYALESAHPEFEYTFLVRSEDRAKPVKEAYPKARFVYGDNNSADVIEKAAKEADIVVHTANSSDDIPSAKAIVKGLTAGHTSSNPAYFIIVSGTGLLIHNDLSSKRFGQPPLGTEHYDDISSLDRLKSLPDSAPHRDLEKVIYQSEADSKGALKLAMLAPPCIYDVGRGAVNQRSMQVPGMIKYALLTGAAPIIGTGKTEWDNVNIHDLSTLVVLLVDAALSHKYDSNPEVFGSNAYYFVENGKPHSWGEVAKWVADEAAAQGYLEKADVKEVSLDDAQNAAGRVAGTWALNSASTASRAKKYLGWEPKDKTLKESLKDAIAFEAKQLGVQAKYKK